MPASPGRQAVLSAEAPRRAVTLDEVRAHRDAITRLGQRFGVRNIRVFGSVARGEATPGSDLDLLVDVDRGHGYFDMAGFALGVEDELGVMTQVATPGGLKPGSVTACSGRPSPCEPGRRTALIPGRAHLGTRELKPAGPAQRLGPARLGAFRVGTDCGDASGRT